MRQQFQSKSLLTQNDFYNFSTKSEYLDRFSNIISILKIQTTFQYLQLKKTDLQFEEISVQLKNYTSKSKVFLIKPQYNTHYHIQEDLSQFSKKLYQQSNLALENVQLRINLK
ncbi:unnamed protein product [Paramecium sonneborni]|uniref:Uncharacterized protein n=1 Tax=Paramecium sonneborni TaxID=65129 RepID=A0A8S1LCL2_9CILI|nr:unnamed protein product [Paramecium sonneborni]